MRILKLNTVIRTKLDQVLQIYYYHSLSNKITRPLIRRCPVMNKKVPFPFEFLKSNNIDLI